jgi:hypothetical protein
VPAECPGVGGFGCRPRTGSTTARTLHYLRRCHFTCDVVERYIAAVQRKHDFLGFADVLAVRRGEVGVLAVQATTKAHVGDRLARATGRAELRTWLAAGNRFCVMGWYQQDGRWHVKQVEVRGEDLQAVAVAAPRARGQRKGTRQTELWDVAADAQEVQP